MAEELLKSSDMTERVLSAVRNYFAPDIDKIRSNNLKVTVNQKAGTLELDIDSLRSSSIVKQQLEAAEKITEG